MRVHLVDGTYELFRQYLAPRPGHLDPDGVEVGGTRAVVRSVFGMLEDGATHLGVATDHVIESFRNDLWDTYKDGAGIDPLLKAQFPLLEDALARARGRRCGRWSTSKPTTRSRRPRAWRPPTTAVEQVIICTPDKDLGQCVGGKVVQLDRRRDILLDADGVHEKFGVPPASIPDWLALVGDSADGFPGLPGFGREDGGRGARAATGTSRRSPTTPAVGRRRRARRRSAGGDARGGTRRRRPVQGAGDVAHRRRRRRRRRLGVDRADTRPRGVVRAVRLTATAPRVPTKLAPKRGVSS